MERERLPEQAEAMDKLVSLCEEKGVDLVLVAGDVFDTYLPSAEAEELFFRAVKGLAGENRAVVIVSGNHDDGVRLAASAPLAGEDGIYIFGNRPAAPPVGGTRKTRAVEAGERFVVIENAAGERVYINALPYPNEARFREEKTEETFPEKISRWIAAGDENYRGDMPHILLSHLFVAGGVVSDSERDIDLGGARAVPVSCLPKEGYVALGHLHKKQKVGENARYSGSLLQYSFDESADKSVLLLETEGNNIRVAEEIPLNAGKKLVRLEAAGAEEALRLLPMYENCYVELTLHLKEPLTASATQALREANEGLVSLIALLKSEEAVPVAARASLSAGELFTEFYRSQYGDDPSDELKTAFLALFAEGEA